MEWMKMLLIVRKRATIIFAALLALIVTSSCRRDNDNDNNNGASTNAKPVEVRLGYFANLTHAQAVLGVHSGEFQTAIKPHTLTTRVFNAGPSMIEALFAGEIDIGYIGPGPAVGAFEKSRGEDIRVIAGAAANGVVIVASPESGIRTMADLKGKRIATPQIGNTQDLAARHYLVHELQQADANNVLPIPNAEQAAMMTRGQIDAAWAPEPWGARLEKEAGGIVIAEEKDLWPEKEFVLTVIIVRPEFMQQHPDIVENMLGVHVYWTERLQDDAAGQVPQLHKALLSLTGKSLDKEVLERAIGRVKFTNQPMNRTFEVMAQWALDLGFSKSKQDLSALVDLSALERVLGAAATTRPAITDGAGGDKQ